MMGTVISVTIAASIQSNVIIAIFPLLLSITINTCLSSHHASALRIRGGVGNDLDFPASSKNQYDIEILTSMRFKIPGHPVLDFNQTYRRQLDAGLASVSINGITVLEVAQGNDPAGLGPNANPARGAATPQQLRDQNSRAVRLFGILLNYMETYSPFYRFMAQFFRGDGYAAYQYVVRFSVLNRTEEQINQLKAEWNDLAIEKVLSGKQVSSYYAQYLWAEYLRFKGEQLNLNGTTICNKFMKDNVKAFYQNHLTYYENNRGNIPTIPVTFAGAGYPPHLTAGGYAHPRNGEEDVNGLAKSVNDVWAGHLIRFGVKGDPLRAYECDDVDEQETANILVSKLTKESRCRHCNQLGHYIKNIDDKTGKVIWCAQFLIDKGFPPEDGGPFKKPMASFARSTKRFATSMKHGAKAMLLTASKISPDKSLPAEFAAAIDDLDEHSSEDSDDDANMSGMEEVAEKVSDQQQRRGRAAPSARPYRGKSPHPRRY